MKKLMATTWACAALTALAGEITFTGATSTDLSDAANWTGDALPGTNDVAVIDFATLDASVTALTNSTDLALGGLVLTNVAKAVTLWGTNTADAAMTTITLGAEGLRSSRSPSAPADSNLTFTVNLATAADQAWSFPDERAVTFNGTISGTATLTVTNTNELVHNVPPNYGGAISYIQYNSGYQRVALAKKGPWAQDVKVPSGRLELRFSDEAKWSDIFPGRAIDAKYGTTLLTLPGVPKVTFEEGDSLKSSSYLVVDTGRLTQTGGAVDAPVQVGYSAYSSLYDMKGGTLKTSDLAIGNYAATAWTTNQWFRMSGGTAEATRISMGYRTGRSDNAMAHGDFTLEGGSFTVTDSSAANAGFILGLNWNTDDSVASLPDIASGAYRQTGGTMKTPRVVFGSAAGNTRRLSAVTNSWFSLTLDGGTFDVGAGGFAVDAARWNVPAAGAADVVGNARHRVSLRGGTLAAYAPFQSTIDLEIPENKTPLTIDVRDNDVFFDAPLWGSGAFEKTGSGTLTLVDATRHHGAIAVKEGALKLVGASSVDDSAAGDDVLCWRWCADDVAADLADGAEIDTWTDTTGARSAVYDATVSEKTQTEAMAKPTVALAAFNGHAGVDFQKAALKLAAADNPLAGATNWTICVVLKTSTKGNGDWDWYAASGVLGREEGGWQNDWGLVLRNTTFGMGLGVYNVSDYSLYSQKNAVDGAPHVIFYTLALDGTRTLVVDGDVQSDTVKLDSATKSPRRASDMYFGVHNIADKAGPRHYSFSGTFAEIRFYPDKAFTLGECASLGAALAAKYGAPDTIIGIGGDDAMAGELATAPAAAMPDDGAAAWDAADLAALADGAAVEDWPSTDGARHATLTTGRLRMSSSSDLTTQSNGGIHAPTFVKNAFKGRPAVRFSGSNALGVVADESPVSGQTAWSVAMVFRTAISEKPTGTRNFYEGRGLFGAELPSTSRADWGVTFWNEQGRLIAGYGGKNSSNADKNVASRAWDLNDNEPHILIATFDTDKGDITIQVDGVGTPYAVQKCSPATPREAMRVLIGAVNGGNFFIGDIAAFRLYDHVLSSAEKTALLEGWTDRFDVPPASRGAETGFATGRQGLSATNLTVAAGASLVLPVAETAPFTLQNGQRLTAAGAIKGTLAVGAGGTLDLDTAQPTAIDTLWLRNGGTLKASFNQATPVPLADFRADGSVTIELADAPAQLPATFTLFTVSGDATVADGTTWQIKGASAVSSVAVEDGCVKVRTAVGTTIFLR